MNLFYAITKEKKKANFFWDHRNPIFKLFQRLRTLTEKFNHFKNKAALKKNLYLSFILISELRLEDKLEPQVFQQIIEIENAYISQLKVYLIFVVWFL